MESNNLTEKLNTFTSLVLKDAEQKREKLLGFSCVNWANFSLFLHFIQSDCIINLKYDVLYTKYEGVTDGGKSKRNAHNFYP